MKFIEPLFLWRKLISALRYVQSFCAVNRMALLHKGAQQRHPVRCQPVGLRHVLLGSCVLITAHAGGKLRALFRNVGQRGQEGGVCVPCR